MSIFLPRYTTHHKSFCCLEPTSQIICLYSCGIKWKIISISSACSIIYSTNLGVSITYVTIPSLTNINFEFLKVPHNFTTPNTFNNFEPSTTLTEMIELYIQSPVLISMTSAKYGIVKPKLYNTSVIVAKSKNVKEALKIP